MQVNGINIHVKSLNFNFYQFEIKAAEKDRFYLAKFDDGLNTLNNFKLVFIGFGIQSLHYFFHFWIHTHTHTHIHTYIHTHTYTHRSAIDFLFSKRMKETRGEREKERKKKRKKEGRKEEPQISVGKMYIIII